MQTESETGKGPSHSGLRYSVIGTKGAVPDSDGTLERRIRFLPSGLPRTSFRRHEFIAEIVHDRRVDPNLFYCIIQPAGSKEILWLGQFDSFEQAKKATEKRIREFHREASAD